MTRIDELEAQFARHPSLPREAVLKTDLLRLGIRFEKGALVRATDGTDGAGDGAPTREHQPKSYFIFSFDMVPQKLLEETEKWHAPEEVARIRSDLQKLLGKSMQVTAELAPEPITRAGGKIPLIVQ